MSGTFRTSIAAFALCLTAAPAFAQKNAAPEITIAHRGAAKALTDLKALLMLTNEKQQKQWDVINKNLQVFLIGIDEKKPIRVDVMIGDDGKLRYVPAFPISDINVFRNRNLKPFGITTRRIAASLYKCKGEVFQGYMRYRNGYAVFSTNRSDLPQTMPAPNLAVADLLKKYDAGIQGTNKATDEKSIAARRALIDKQRKQFISLVTQKEGESDADFELRKLLMEQQFNEIERFYAETSNLKIGWKLGGNPMLGRADLDLSAIKGTELAKSIELLGKQPSYFANVPKAKDPILSMRVNWPLDEMRKTHALEIFKALHKRHIVTIDSDTARNDEQKAAGRKIADLILKLLSENVDQGIVDTFADVHKNAGKKNTAVGGFRTANGDLVVEMLKLLPKSKKGREVTMDVAKVGNVRIHLAKLELPDDSPLKMFLGESTVYIGTSKDAVWFASGQGALPELKIAINAQAGPAVAKPAGEFVDVFIKVKPWLELRSKAAGTKGRPEIRALAEEALKDQDALTMKLTRKGDKVLGEMNVQTDVLRFIGAMIARFSANTLDESGGKKKKKIKLKR